MPEREVLVEIMQKNNFTKGYWYNLVPGSSHDFSICDPYKKIIPISFFVKLRVPEYLVSILTHQFHR